MRYLRADGSFISLEAGDQIYSWEAPDGYEYHWSVKLAMAYAQARNEVIMVSLSESGIDWLAFMEMCPEVDFDYALTTDLTRPLLFVPVGEKVRLIDGSHRVCKALLTGVDELPACILTQEEANDCLICRTPMAGAQAVSGQRCKPATATGKRAR